MGKYKKRFKEGRVGREVKKLASFLFVLFLRSAETVENMFPHLQFFVLENILYITE